jgi:hypothetical protein
MTTMLVGTREYLVRTIVATADLSAQTIAFSFDRGTTYYPATWDAAPSVVSTEKVNGVDTTYYSRKAKVLLGDTVPLPALGEHPVWIKITDTPEIPIIPAGSLVISGND